MSLTLGRQGGIAQPLKKVGMVKLLKELLNLIMK